MVSSFHFLGTWPVSIQSTDFPSSRLIANNTASPALGSGGCVVRTYPGAETAPTHAHPKLFEQAKQNQYFSAGLSRRVQPVLVGSVFANILRVSKGSRLTRRRLHNTVRKTILSYYSEEEAAKIVKAAKKQRVTISNFVASAALREAEVVNSKPDKRQ